MSQAVDFANAYTITELFTIEKFLNNRLGVIKNPETAAYFDHLLEEIRQAEGMVNQRRFLELFFRNWAF